MEYEIEVEVRRNQRIMIFLEKLLLLYVFIVHQHSYAQPTAQGRNKKPYNYILTAGYVFVNDNEDKLFSLSDATSSWNYAPFPSSFSINKLARKAVSNEGVFTFTPLSPKTIVNDSTGLKGFLASANYALKYNFNQVLNLIPEELDPFVAVGIGLTYRYYGSANLIATSNLHLGLNLWLSKHWGLQFQGIGKLALVSEIYASNKDYVQFTAGLNYRTLPRKKYAKHKKRYSWTRQRNRYRKRGSG